MATSSFHPSGSAIFARVAKSIFIPGGKSAASSLNPFSYPSGKPAKGETSSSKYFTLSLPFEKTASPLQSALNTGLSNK